MTVSWICCLASISWKAASFSGLIIPSPLTSGFVTLRTQFEQYGEVVLDWQARKVRETRRGGQFARLGFAHRYADARSAVGERRGHAVERADRVGHLAKRLDIVLELARQVDFLDQVGASGLERAANRAHQSGRVDRIVYDIEGRDEIECLLRQVGAIGDREAHAIIDTALGGIAARALDCRGMDVEAGHPRVGERWRGHNRGAAAAAS